MLDSIKELSIEQSRIAPRCPWQNPYAERWVGTARRELFDRVVVFGREHALALLRPYLNYYHDDRTHLGLNKETPTGRQAMGRPEQSDAQVVALPKVGGLHHRYEWRRAADKEALANRERKEESARGDSPRSFDFGSGYVSGAFAAETS